MNLFQPSQRILEKICLDEHSYFEYRTIPKTASESAHNSIIDSIIHQIETFYQQTGSCFWKFNFEKLNAGETSLLLIDGIRNAQVHGSKESDFYVLGLWLGKKGICFGFQDEGGYFKREDIKQKFENKLPITEFDRGVISQRVGVQVSIYPATDLIEVDTQSGTLYCVQFLDRILIGKRDL